MMSVSSVCLIVLIAVGHVMAAYRSLSGVGNNEVNLLWGASGSPLSSDGMPVSFTDGIGSLPDHLNSTRWISLEAFGSNFHCDERGLSTLAAAWAEFIAYDISYTEFSAESAPIAVPAGDPYFDPWNNGNTEIPFFRSAYDPASGVIGYPRSAINGACAVRYNYERWLIITGQTSFVDASGVYGTDPDRLWMLRSGVNGTLRLGSDGLLPRNTEGADNLNEGRNPHPETLFLAGDLRVNRSPGLAVLHTLWVREHNWHAERLSIMHPEWSDNQTFEEARRWIIAEIEAITFYEFLPALLGQVLPRYDGYKLNTNPSATSFFTTAAFRFGHSVAPTVVPLLDEEQRPIPNSPLVLRNCYYEPSCLEYFDELLRGMISSCQQSVDLNFVDDVRNFAFGLPYAGGIDLPAVDLQRNRDHGISRYNDARQHFGLPRIQSFSELTSDPELAERLRQVYDNDVEQLEAFVGGHAEDHVPNSSLGPLFFSSVLLMFTRLRDGDRFHFESEAAGFTDEEKDILRNTKLSDIIFRHTSLQAVQCSVFYNTPALDCSRTRNGTRAEVHRPDPRKDEAFVSLLNGDIIISWKLKDSSISFEITALTTGWIAIGFNTKPAQMLGADVAIGYVDENNAVTVTDSFISDRQADCPGVCPDTDLGGTDDLFDVSGIRQNGTTILRFSRQLQTSDPNDVAISHDSDNYLVFAFSPDGTSKLTYHGANKGGVTVNFSDRYFEETYSKKDALVHGILMFISWAVILPFGIFLPRHLKIVWNKWFRAHLALQYFGMIIVLVAFMIILQYTSKLGHSHFSSNRVHACLGLATILFALLGPILGQLTAMSWTGDSPTTPWWPHRIHWITGYSMVILSWVTMFWGLYEYRAPTKFYGLLAGWLALITIIFLALFFVSSLRPNTGENEPDDDAPPVSKPTGGSAPAKNPEGDDDEDQSEL